MTPVTLTPHQPVVAGSMAAGSVRYYAAAVCAGKVLIDDGERHLPLRHSHHRYAICGPNGVQQLTVPLVGETNAMPVAMRDVRISEHCKWRHLHWGALFSAYGRSPYFDYVAADLEPIIMGNQKFLLDFNEQLQQLVVDFMDLPVTFGHYVPDAADGILDLRGKICGKRPDTLPITDLRYYQVWEHRHGFIPGLSILDLLMNAGREGILTLMAMTE